VAVTGLSQSERELVAIGAAVASNCIPCVEYHVPEARKSGLTDAQIAEAVRLADRVRQVPAKKVLDAAIGMLAVPQPDHGSSGTPGPSCSAVTASCGHARD